jgi:hypothetical protein
MGGSDYQSMRRLRQRMLRLTRRRWKVRELKGGGAALPAFADQSQHGHLDLILMLDSGRQWHRHGLGRRCRRSGL